MADHLDLAEDAAIDSAINDIDNGPSPIEIKSNWEDTQRAHAAFKAANDKLLDQMRHGRADPVTIDEVNRLNAELDRLTHAPEVKALRRPPPAPAGGDTTKAAIVAIGKEVLRQGQVIDQMSKSRGDVRQLATLQAKAASLERRVRAAEVKRDRPPGLASRYPGVGGQFGPARRASAERAYKAAIIQWMRTGEETYRGLPLKSLYLAAYGRKDMHTELNPQGGFLVHPERRGGSPLEAAMAELTPMRRLATVYTLTEGDVFEIPQNLKGTQAGWIGEMESRPTTTTPEIALTSIPAMELYAQPAVSQRLLDHVDFDAESWLTQEVAEAFAKQEGPAFISGDGSKKPRGLLTYDFVTNHDHWEHGKFRLVETGVAGAFPPMAPTGSPPTVPGHVLIDTQYALKTAHQANASWLMSRSTVGTVRKLTDERGQYLWQPGVAAGQPATLLGSRIDEEPNMPAIGVDTVSIGYGDWSRVYAIVEKGGVRMLRDPYSQKPHVLFYTTKYVGGAVQNFDAAIFLRFSAAA